MTTAPIEPANPLAHSTIRVRSLAGRRAVERAILSSLAFCASISIFTTIAIIVVLAAETYTFFTFESAILRNVMVSGEARPLQVAFASEAGSPVAIVSGEDLIERVDFADRGVKVNDIVRVVSADQRVGDLAITKVGAQQLVLAKAPDSLQGSVQDIEIWRDEATIGEFLFSGTWSPLLGAEKHFGIWPLVSGTLMVTLIAMLVAIPLGLMTAVYLSEYAHSTIRAVLKPVLEVLAGVPTVVYGFFALTVITPLLQKLNDGVDIYNVLSAGIAVGIMCLPIVCSISEDALRAVPRSLREGAYGVGGTRFDVSTKVVVPAAMSGIVAASLLAIARAVGETMIVTLAAGNLAKLVLDPRGQGQTMTAYMVQIFLGDASNFGIEYYSSYAVAASLFVLTFAVTVIGHIVRVKFREAYD